MSHLIEHFRFVLIDLLKDGILIEQGHIPDHYEDVGLSHIDIWLENDFQELLLNFFRGRLDGQFHFIFFEYCLANHLYFTKKFKSLLEMRIRRVERRRLPRLFPLSPFKVIIICKELLFSMANLLQVLFINTLAAGYMSLQI
jgi:hypothetical protein